MRRDQDVPVAPSEHTEAQTNASPPVARRFGVYLVAVAALVLVVWSLIEGGDRDLWSPASALVQPVIAVLVS